MGKKIVVHSYLIKWSDRAKEQDREEEEAAVVTPTQKRKCFAKPERNNSVITYCHTLSF